MQNTSLGCAEFMVWGLRGECDLVENLGAGLPRARHHLSHPLSHLRHLHLVEAFGVLETPGWALDTPYGVLDTPCGVLDTPCGVLDTPGWVLNTL